MALFGADPKDELIRELREERDHYRARVAELEKQVMALADRAAYRLVHNAPVPSERPAAEAKPDIYAQRGEVYSPEMSLAQIEATLRGDA